MSVDVTPWFGTFHYHTNATLLDQRITNDIGGAVIANLELRADHTATQMYEPCDADPQTFSYQWVQGEGMEIILLPPSGDATFQWFGLGPQEQITLTLGPDCNALSASVPDSGDWQRGALCRREECQPPEFVSFLTLCEGEGSIECGE